MPEYHSPYDTGYRLEPKPWPAGPDTNADDYGKVDFTNDFGETVFTAHVQKTEAGYILRVDEHQDVEVAFETSSQRQEREAAMMQLDQAIRVLASQHENAVTFHEEDPDTFGAGHYVIENTRADHRLVVTEQYVGTDSSDPDRIPNSWRVDVDELAVEQGSRAWMERETRDFDAAAVGELISYATDWVNHRAREQATHDALHASTSRTLPHGQHPAPPSAPTY